MSHVPQRDGSGGAETEVRFRSPDSAPRHPHPAGPPRNRDVKGQKVLMPEVRGLRAVPSSPLLSSRAGMVSELRHPQARQPSPQQACRSVQPPHGPWPARACPSQAPASPGRPRRGAATVASLWAPGPSPTFGSRREASRSGWGEERAEGKGSGQRPRPRSNTEVTAFLLATQ